MKILIRVISILFLSWQMVFAGGICTEMVRNITQNLSKEFESQPVISALNEPVEFIEKIRKEFKSLAQSNFGQAQTNEMNQLLIGDFRTIYDNLQEPDFKFLKEYRRAKWTQARSQLQADSRRMQAKLEEEDLEDLKFIRDREMTNSAVYVRGLNLKIDLLKSILEELSAPRDVIARIKSLQSLLDKIGGSKSINEIIEDDAFTDFFNPDFLGRLAKFIDSNKKQILNDVNAYASKLDIDTSLLDRISILSKNLKSNVDGNNAEDFFSYSMFNFSKQVYSRAELKNAMRSNPDRLAIFDSITFISEFGKFSAYSRQRRVNHENDIKRFIGQHVVMAEEMGPETASAIGMRPKITDIREGRIISYEATHEKSAEITYVNSNGEVVKASPHGSLIVMQKRFNEYNPLLKKDYVGKNVEIRLVAQFRTGNKLVWKKTKPLKGEIIYADESKIILKNNKGEEVEIPVPSLIDDNKWLKVEEL